MTTPSVNPGNDPFKKDFQQNTAGVPAAVPSGKVEPVQLSTTPSITAFLGRYGKLYAAILGIVLSVLVQKYAGQSNTWLPYLTMACAALGVYATPNTPKAP